LRADGFKNIINIDLGIEIASKRLRIQTSNQFYRDPREKIRLGVSSKHSESQPLRQGFNIKILRTSLKLAKQDIYTQCFLNNF